MAESLKACAFCGGTAVAQTHAGLYHPNKADHGPFDFFRCRVCGSGLTLDPPSDGALGELYGSFKDGLPDLHREIMQDDPQNELYSLCARRLLKMVGGAKPLKWIDVGAGGGELSAILHRMVPGGQGIAIDLHLRPHRLKGLKSVEWIQADINARNLAEDIALQGSADAVISTAVWEHVLRPDLYARNLLSLLRPGGVLYLLCPNYGSLAARLMGRHWPYFTPGEHLNMPTPKGAVLCLRREWDNLHRGGAPAYVKSAALALPYSLRYVMRRFRVDWAGKLIPPGFGFALPVGALETILVAPG